MDQVVKKILQDLKAELMDEFDQNFARKGFFGQSWPVTKLPSHIGSLMMRTGNLRKSLRAKVNGASIVFFSSKPYASLHNEGGTIVVTAKMKKFFWKMYLKSSKSKSYMSEDHKSYSIKRKHESDNAEIWKALALKKVGSKIVFKPRRFIGSHPQVDIAVRRVVDTNMKGLHEFIKNKLTR